MAVNKLEFGDVSEIKHHMAASVADDLVRDYETSVKSLMRNRKLYSALLAICSIDIVLTSLACGIFHRRRNRGDTGARAPPQCYNRKGPTLYGPPKYCVHACVLVLYGRLTVPRHWPAP